MTERIIQTETLTPEEHKQLFEWGEDIFGGNLKQFSWRPMEQRFILKIDGESVGQNLLGADAENNLLLTVSSLILPESVMW